MRPLFRSLRLRRRRECLPAAPLPAAANKGSAPPLPLMRPPSEDQAFDTLLNTARCRAHWRPATRNALQLALTLDSFQREALQEGLGWYFLVHPDRSCWLRAARALNHIGAEEIATVLHDACRTYQRQDHYGSKGPPPFAAEEERLWEMKAARRLQRRANRYFWGNAPWTSSG